MASWWKNSADMRWPILLGVLVVLSACARESSLTVAQSTDPDLATPSAPVEFELTEILEHVNTQASSFGDGWTQTGEWFAEGGEPPWNSGCVAFDHLGDLFDFGSSLTTTWERREERVTLRTDDLNWRAYEFAFGVERIPDACDHVDVGAATVQVSPVDESMFAGSLDRLMQADPRGVVVAITLDAYPVADPETSVVLSEFEPGAETWVVVATRQNVVSQLIYSSRGSADPTGIVALVDAQVAALAGASPDATGSFPAPEPTPSVQAGVAENVQLVLGDECRNDGTIEAGGVLWTLSEAAPFDWAGVPVINGTLEMDGTVARFTPNSDDGVPPFSVPLTTGAVNADCPTWDIPENGGEPSNVRFNLDCGDRPVVEERVPDENSDPLDIATSNIVAAANVEPVNPLVWDVFGDAGVLIGTIALGDTDNPDWQIWTCG